MYRTGAGSGGVLHRGLPDALNLVIEFQSL